MIFLILLPLWMFTITLVLIAMMLPISVVYSHRMRRILFLYIIIDPKTYKNIDVGKWLWGSIYYALYFLILFPLFFVFIIFIFQEPQWKLLKIVPIRIFYVYFSVLYSSRFFTMPYVALLRTSCRTPTRTMIKMDINDLLNTYKIYEQKVLRKLTAKKIKGLIIEFEKLWRSLWVKCRQDEIAASKYGNEILNDYREKRIQVLRDNICKAHFNLFGNIPSSLLTFEKKRLNNIKHKFFLLCFSKNENGF
jgi:hypothetical protein